MTETQSMGHNGASEGVFGHSGSAQAIGTG